MEISIDIKILRFCKLEIKIFKKLDFKQYIFIVEIRQLIQQNVFISYYSKICFHLNIDQKIDPAFDATLGHN
jgi:hypothetical protein